MLTLHYFAKKRLECGNIESIHTTEKKGEYKNNPEGYRTGHGERAKYKSKHHRR